MKRSGFPLGTHLRGPNSFKSDMGALQTRNSNRNECWKGFWEFWALLVSVSIRVLLSGTRSRRDTSDKARVLKKVMCFHSQTAISVLLIRQGQSLPEPGLSPWQSSIREDARLLDALSVLDKLGITTWFAGVLVGRVCSEQT